MQKKYRNLLKDTVIFGLGNIGSKIITFFLVPFYTFYLTPEEYGISDLVFTISQLAIPFFSLVIFDAVIRFALYRKERPQDTLLVGLVIWFLGSILSFVLTPLIGLYQPIASWKWYVSAYVSINILVSIELNYLKAVNKNLIYSIICILQTLTLALLNIFLVAKKQMGIRGYLISYIGSNFVAASLAFVIGNLYRDIKDAKYDSILAKQMIVYSSPLILNNLSWWVIQSSDKLMLENMVNADALGIYTVASRIPSLITVFITIFQQAWGISSIKEMDSTKDSGFFTDIFTFYSFIAFLGGFGICTVIKPFMELYVQSTSYGEVWRYVPLLLASAVFSAIAAYSGSMYGALKKSMNNMLSTMIAALINIIVNYIGILAFGIWGAMIGTITSYFILAFIRLIDVKRFVNIGINWKQLILNSVLLVFQAVVVSLNTPMVGITSSLAIFATFIILNRTKWLAMFERLKLRR